MLLQPLTVAGLLALPATQAFLLPPEVSDADTRIAHDLAVVGPQITEIHVLDVECPGCPILVKGKHGHNIQAPTDRANHLELTFTIDHQPAFDRLLVNGMEIYPSSNPLRALSEVLSAPQILDAEDGTHHDGRKHKRPHHGKLLPQRLGYGLNVAGKKDANGEFMLVDVDLQILEVGTTFIDGIPNVNVKLVKDKAGRLVISRIGTTEPKRLLEAAEGGPEECKTMLCTLMAIAKGTKEKLGKLKPFGKCHGGHAKGGMRPAGGHPHPNPLHGGGAHWRERYGKHSWGQLFKNIASHIILPVLIGIVAGVSISLVGMAVGTVLVSLWRMSRRRRSHRRSRRASRKEAAVAEEKAVLIEDQDPPPSYDEEETAKPAEI
ncbi:hypothetical protein MFIFM68171_02462 [Madurella fahalii]|uniref:DUF7728 domain-containing protein n=1 Tax=Madurella fahalii TaxID=1157608 RepID=A0ABQ0G3D8_9PEZI